MNVKYRVRSGGRAIHRSGESYSEHQEMRQMKDKMRHVPTRPILGVTRFVWFESPRSAAQVQAVGVESSIHGVKRVVGSGNLLVGSREVTEVGDSDAAASRCGHARV